MHFSDFKTLLSTVDVYILADLDASTTVSNTCCGQAATMYFRREAWLAVNTLKKSSSDHNGEVLLV